MIVVGKPRGGVRLLLGSLAARMRRVDENLDGVASMSMPSSAKPMRGVVAALLCVLGACQASAGHSDIAPSPAVDVIEQFDVIEQWRGAFLARDIVAMAACYEPGDEVVLIHSTGQMLVGCEAIRADYEAAFAATVFDDVRFDPYACGESGDMAWASGRLRMLTRAPVGDARWTLEIHTTFHLRRRAGKWRIVHEQSTPIAGVPRLRER